MPPSLRSVHHMLAALLAAAAANGCGPSCGSGGGGSNTSIDRTFSDADVTALRARFGIAADAQPSCEQICASIIGTPVAAVRSCSVTWPGAAAAAADAAATDAGGSTSAKGRVVCAAMLRSGCEGRRPMDHREWRFNATAPGRDASPPHLMELGAAFANIAYLESASVLAFLELTHQLQALAAPVALRDRCLMAADDERRHAAAMTLLAHACGARVAPPRTTERASALPHGAAAVSMEAVARHNAAAGCVYETWSALISHRRRLTAADLGLGHVFAEIAADETRHAQLSWDLHAWFMTQLRRHNPAAAERVLLAQGEAMAKLPALARGQATLPAALRPFEAHEAEVMAVELVACLAAMA